MDYFLCIVTTPQSVFFPNFRFGRFLLFLTWIGCQMDFSWKGHNCINGALQVVKDELL